MTDSADSTDTTETEAAPATTVPDPRPPLERLLQNVQKVFVGRRDSVELLVTALLAGGHVLIEDAPGVGKTTLARTLARSIDCDFKRVQFTPDLQPGDVLGVSLYRPDERRFVWMPGPIFTNVLLADEVNRTNPRTQAALLEAMSEGQVTIDGETRPLPGPFLVLATQNPLESEGTFALPDSQLDRFLLRLHIGYPSREEEKRVLVEQRLAHPLQSLKAVVTRGEIQELQRRTRDVHVEERLLDYIVDLARSTREHPSLSAGVSPRGSLALRRAAQALALVRGRDHVQPDDLKELVPPVWTHRIALRDRWDQTADGPRGVLIELLDKTSVPV